MRCPAAEPAVGVAAVSAVAAVPAIVLAVDRRLDLVDVGGRGADDRRSSPQQVRGVRRPAQRDQRARLERRQVVVALDLGDDLGAIGEIDDEPDLEPWKITSLDGAGDAASVGCRRR